MAQYAVIGNGTITDGLTFQKRNITNHIHSIYNDEKNALKAAHWLNSKPIGLQYHVSDHFRG